MRVKVSAICPGGVADELVDASPEEILRSEKIDPSCAGERDKETGSGVFIGSTPPRAALREKR
jgi:hypothetical protein